MVLSTVRASKASAVATGVAAHRIADNKRRKRAPSWSNASLVLLTDLPSTPRTSQRLALDERISEHEPMTPSTLKL